MGRTRGLGLGWWVSGWFLEGWMGEWVWVGVWVGGVDLDGGWKKEGRNDAWMDRSMAGWVDEWMDGGLDHRLEGGSVEGWMDGGCDPGWVGCVVGMS